VTDLIVRLLEPFLNLLLPARGRRRRCPYTYPYSCDYVGGPTTHRTGERPLRGEDSRLVRPYLLAHEAGA
jgi:hypothetical protein